MLESRLLLSGDPLTTLEAGILTAPLSENPEPAPATGTDTPSVPSVNLSVSGTDGAEAGTTAITVSLTADAPVIGDQTVTLLTSGAGITADDYTLTDGDEASGIQIKILDGQTTGTVAFTVKDDLLNEGAELVTLAISDPSAGLVLGDTTTQDITITDDDDAGTSNYVLPEAGDYRLALNGDIIEISDSMGTIVATRALGVDPLVINGTAGDDTLTVDFSSGDITVPITFNGGDQSTEVGDALTIIGKSDQAITALPSATSPGAGVITIGDLGVVNFTGLEPVNMNGGGGTFNVTFPNGNDVITIDEQGNNLQISGTSGGTTFERFNLKNFTTVTVDTTTNDGTADIVTIAGPITTQTGVTNLIVTTGTGGGVDERIDITGPATFAGDVTLTSARINSNGLLTAGGTVTLNANVGGITDGNGASTNIAAANLVASAVTGIGTANALETSVTNLEATGGTGGVNVANTGNLTVGGIGATTGVSATGGNITLTSTGALTLGESLTSAGAATLTATGALSSAAGATLTSATGSTLTSGASGTLAGVIAGAGGFTYQGSSVLTLTATNTYGGATTITGGTLLVNGSIASPSVTVQSGATLGGSGSVAGTVAVQNGGVLSPGSSPGILSTGSVSFVPGSTFKAEVNGTTPGTNYDQLAVTGTVNLGGSTLNVSGTIASSSASPIVLISNDGTDAVTGTFAGLSEGAVVTINGIPFTISYVSGTDSNDVVLRSQATVNLSVSAAAGTEAGSTAITVTATANAAVGGNQTVDLGVAGTNITAADYTLSNNIISILSGQTSGSVTFTVNNDTLLEGAESVTLTISNPSAGLILGSTTTQNIGITDDENATLDIAATSSATETGGAQSVGVVTLTIGGTGTGTFALGDGISLTADVINAGTGTATSGTDYAAFGTQTVTFNGGALSGATRNTSLTPMNDRLLEGDETVNLTLQNLGGSTVTRSLGNTNNVTTITDDESATLAIAATSSATETGGAQNVGEVTLTITGSGTGTFALGSGISLTADVVDAGTGTATSGADYTAFGTQTVTFNGGAATGATQNTSLTSVNDRLLEGSETVGLTLQNLGGSAVSSSLGNDSNLTTITDDESGTLAIAATSSATETGGAQSVGVVTLTIGGTGTGTVALGAGISLTADVVDAGGGTATSGADYTAFGTQTVTFNGGALSGATRNTTLTPVNDTLLEGSETVALTLQNLNGSAVTKSLGNTANATTITDDESATLAIAATSTVTEQGGAQNVGVTLTITGSGSGTFALGDGITLTADVVDAGTGTATSGADYTAFGTQTVTFNGGAATGATQNTTLSPVNDRLLEGDETVDLTLQNLGGSSVAAALGNSSNVTTITDDESATLAIAATSAVTEQGGAQTVGVVTLTITGSGSGTFALGDGISLTADVVDAGTGTATSVTDYAAFGTQTVTFDAGAVTGATQNTTLSPVNDLLLEGSETVKLTLQNLGGSAVTKSLGNTANVTTITDDESATLAIAATSSATEIGGAQNVGEVTLTITGSGTGTLALGSGISLTADVVDAGTGTASSGADYTAFGTQTVTFNGGALSGATRTTTLTPVNDRLLEGSETVQLTLQNLGGSTVAAVLGNSSNVTTITDDENATLDIATTSSVTEQGGAQTVGVVTLTIGGTGSGTAALGSGISLTADVVDAGSGTATSGTDYTAFGTQTVTFNGGALSGATRNTSLTPVNDTLLEGSETIALTLQNLNGSAVNKVLGNASNLTTITDDESATLAIAATSTVTEQGGPQNVGVTLTITGSGTGTFALGDGISLTADVVDAGGGTALSGTDYTAFGTQPVTFDAGTVTGTTQNVSLSPVNDTLLEGSETVKLKLQNLGGSAVNTTLGNVNNVATITDDESATLAIAATSTVAEQGGAQNVGVTLTITGSGSGTFALGDGITLTADVVDQLTGTAISSTDYAVFGTKTIAFNGGAVTGTIQNVALCPVNDTLLEGSETVKLKLQNLGGSAVTKSLGTSYNTTTITDDESATLALATTSTATEAGGVQNVGVVTLTITGSGVGTFALGNGISLTANVVDAGGGTALSGTDYTAFGTQLVTFNAGAVSGATQNVSLSPVNDLLLEGSETVKLTLQNLGGSAVVAALGNTSNLTTITDDESATLAIAATSTVTEQGGPQNVGVTLTISGTGTGTFALGSGISLTADVVDAGTGTATSGADYAVFGTKTVTFNGGAVTGTIQNVALCPVNDTLLEGSETVKLTLQNLGGSPVTKSLSNVDNLSTITDDESATLAIAATSTATEAGGAQNVGAVTLTITGSGTGTFALGPGITVTANVVDLLTGTATSGTDYTALGTQPVTFDNGAVTGTTKSVSLSPVSDGLVEPNETVKLNLQTLGGSAVTKSLGNTNNVTTITDDDTATAVDLASVQYSDKVKLSAIITTGAPASLTGTVKFSIYAGGVWTQVASAAVNSVNTTSVTVEGTTTQILLAPGSYTYKAEFCSTTPAYNGSVDTDTLTVTQENALATYVGPTYISTPNATATTAIVPLQATIVDINDLGAPGGLGLRGNVDNDDVTNLCTNARVTFTIYDAATNILLKTISNVAVNLLNPADPTVGTALANWSADIGSNDAVTYRVHTVVTNYYTRDTVLDDELVTVAKPLDNSVTGGGYIINTDSAGLYAADDGLKTNFGFNVKFNKSGTNPQGKVNIIFRRLEDDGVEHIYQIKSTAISSLGVNAADGTSTFLSKATLTDVTNPSAPISLPGPFDLTIRTDDNGEPGTGSNNKGTDKISVALFKGPVLWFSSNFSGGVQSQLQVLDGGNIRNNPNDERLLYFVNSASSPTAPGDQTSPEGDTGCQNMVFTVRLSQPSTQTVTVNYSTKDGDAVAGSDYVATSGTLTFAPGATTATFTVQVKGDLLAESDELFYVTLSNATGAGIQDPIAMGIIVDNEPDALHVAGGPNVGGQVGDDLQSAMLTPVVTAAVKFWAAQGASAEDLARLAGTPIRIEDLGGSLLGETTAGIVTLDDDAAGYGWSTSLTAVVSGEVDLFSTVVHEFGHVLGLEHNVLDPNLAVGARELPLVIVWTQPAPPAAGVTVLASPEAPVPQTGPASLLKSIEWHVDRAAAPGLPQDSAWVPSLIDWHFERAGAPPQSESVYVPSPIDWSGDLTGQTALAAKARRLGLLERS